MAEKLVCGVGRYVAGTHSCQERGSKTREYSLWASMIHRCYGEVNLLVRPTYVGCTVSENFKDFQYFAVWCKQQIGYEIEGWQLDKDLLISGNKIYSENTCVFVPSQINILTVKRQACRGLLPIGVGKSRCSHRKYVASMGCGLGTRKALGTFHTPEAAFTSYKTAKEGLIKQRANEFRDQIDPRAYEALMNYEILITD